MSFSVKTKTASDESNLLGIEPDDTVSSQENVPLPYFAGPGKFPLKWIGDKYDLYSKEPPGGSPSGKKGGGNSKAGWVNYGSVVGLMAGGPIDELHYILLDNRIVWEGLITKGASPSYAQVIVPDYGTFRLYWGTSSQTTVDNLVLSSCPDDHPPYRNIPYMVVKGLRFGVGKDAPGNLEIGVERKPDTNVVPAAIANVNTFEGANPFAIAAEVLLDDMQGAGQDATLIDDTQWAPISITAKRIEAYPIDGDGGHMAHFGNIAPRITTQQTLRRFLNDIFSYGDGFVRLNGDKLEAGLETHDGTVPESLPEITHHDFVRTPILRKADIKPVGEVVATFRDRTRHMKKSTHSDDSLADTYDTFEYDIEQLKLEDFCTEHQTMRWVAEYLLVANQFLGEMQGTIFKSALQGRLVGDEVQLNYLPGQVDTPYRIIRIDETANPDEVIVLLQQKKGVFQLSYVPPEELRPDIVLTAPIEIVNYRFYQTSKLYSGVDPVVWVLAEKNTDNAVGLHVHYSEDDTTYDLIGEQNSFALRGTLDEAVTIGALSFDINASGFDIDKLASQSDAGQIADALLLIVNGEVMSIGDVVAVGGGIYTVTVLRGRLKTNAAVHSVDDEIWIIEKGRVENISHSEFPQDGSSRYFKLQPYSYSGGAIDLGDVTGVSYDFDDYLIQDPTGFRVDGVLNGYAFKFSVHEPDIIGAYVWVSDSPTGFTTDPTFTQSLRVPRRLNDSGTQSYSIAFTYTDKVFAEAPKTRYFKIQLFDSALNANLSNVIGPVSSNSGTLNQSQRVVVTASTQLFDYWALEYNPAEVTLICSADGYTNPTFQWYFYDSEGTKIIIPEATEAVYVAGPQMSNITPPDLYRTYGCQVNNDLYDEKSIWASFIADIARAARIMDNEVVTIFVDENGDPLPGELGELGPTLCRTQFFRGAAQLIAGAAATGSNYTLTVPTGLTLSGYDAFYLSDAAQLTGTETDFEITFTNQWGAYTFNYRVIKRAIANQGSKVFLTINGDLEYAQPITPTSFTVDAVARKGQYDSLGNRTINVNVSSAGIVTIDEDPDDGSGIVYTLVSTNGQHRITFTHTESGATNFFGLYAEEDLDSTEMYLNQGDFLSLDFELTNAGRMDLATGDFLSIEP